MMLAARPTTYNGVHMRSRMEARVAAFFDRCDWPWEYEPRAFASANGQYLPDFRSGGAYLEVKGATPTSDEFDALLSRMQIIRASEPDARLALTYDLALRNGVFLVNYPKSPTWWYMAATRCPDHPDLIRLALWRVNGDVIEANPWCAACDPGYDIWVELRDTAGFRVVEAS